MIQRFTLPPQYLPRKDGEPEFQRAFAEAVAKAEPGAILFVHAPTGAGKTHMIIEQARGIEKFDQRALVMTPTNALAAQIQEDLMNAGVDTARWNASELTKQGAQRHQELIQLIQTKRAIVTNPDILHLFTQHDYLDPGRVKRNPDYQRILRQERVSPWNFALDQVNLHVFDEYHAYDERLLASVLTYLLKCRGLRQDGSTAMKHCYVFLSATPDPALPNLLRQLGFTHWAEITEEASPHEPEGGGRPIKGEIIVEVRNDGIEASLPHQLPAERTLFVFNSLLREEEAARILQRRGIHEIEHEDDEHGYVHVTGLDTTSSRDQLSMRKARILLATSKVDVGLNIPNLAHVVMEPGWSEQQFWQRFGRAARGEDGRVTLHFEDYASEVVDGIRGPGYAEFAQQLGGLLHKQRVNQDRVLRLVGAYAATYRASTKDSATRDAIQLTGLPRPAAHAARLVNEMLRHHKDDPDRLGSEATWNRVLRSLAGLRGSRIEVPATFAWREGTYRVDLGLLLSGWAHEKQPNGTYHIVERHETRLDVCFHYRVINNPRPIAAPKGRLDRETGRKLAALFRDTVTEEIDDELSPFWAAFTEWLTIMPPDQWMPDEANEDAIFI